jgi:hypothetical protein
VAEGGERWTSEEGRSIRTVTKIKSLLDCGPVTYPAYDSATVAVAKRSYNSFVAEKRQKSEAMQKADLIREESKRFLAERRDCGRDEGGKFAKGNSCAGATEAGAGDSAWASGAKVGAILGAGLGSIGGGVGIATGAALGAVGGAVVGTTGLNRQDALKGAYKKTGTDLSKVDKAAKSLGMKMKVFAFDKNTVAMESGDSIALITDGSQFSKDAKGVSFHYQPGADAGGKFSVSSVEKAAKAVGAKNVSVEAWSDKDVKALEAKGYKKVVDSPGGYSTSKGVYEKKTGKSRRSYDDLMAFYESRAEDCGRGEGGKFGGGNKCAGDGKYAEWKKGDHKDKAKEKETQDFIDKAREDQTISAGKDGGKSDDGGGVQTWSKGDDYPWTAKQVGTDDGYVQGQHPDGSKTEKYPFKGDSAEAYKKVSEEIKRRKGSRASQVVSDTLKFLRDRRA